MAGLLAALPVDDWAEPRRLLDAHPAAARRTAFMPVRPEMVRQGASMRRTVDLNSVPGALFLVHEDPCEIERTYRTLRTLEQ